MAVGIIFWDKNINRKKAAAILRNEADPRFLELTATLLSRSNSPREVFSAYLKKTAFCRNWRKIKRRMRLNKWNDARIVFWDEVYRILLPDIDKKELAGTKKRDLEIDPVIKDMINTIRRIRKENGMTQADLAEKAGLSQQAVSFVEQGYINISIRTLMKIAKALGLRISLSNC